MDVELIMKYVDDLGISAIAIITYFKFMPEFLKQHHRIAVASEQQVVIGDQLVQKVNILNTKVESVEKGLSEVRTEVMHLQRAINEH
jgi:hypothetical protein